LPSFSKKTVSSASSNGFKIFFYQDLFAKAKLFKKIRGTSTDLPKHLRSRLAWISRRVHFLSPDLSITRMHRLHLYDAARNVHLPLLLVKQS
jgi:hypothetical protein